LATLLAAATFASPAARADTGDAATTETEAAGPAIGDAAPVWTDLVGIDDQTHSLGDLSEAKAVIVVFTCNHCPVAQAYEDRIVELAADYADKGVELVAINVNNMEADKLPAMKERAEEKGFKFVYLYDPTQAIGRAFGATVTPHAFLLDGQRRVAYMGAIDDNMDPDKVTQHHLRNAIDAVLAGNAPTVATTKQFGCGIRYE
jgi:thiol-disulfide isomerase/thioredoxin